MRPSRRPLLSGRNAQERANCHALDLIASVVYISYPYHQERGNDPIHNDRKANLCPQLLGFEGQVKGLVFDFAEDWIHHDKKTNC